MAAGTLVDTAAGRTAAAGGRVLVVDRVAQGDRRRRIFAGVTIGQPLQHGIGTRSGGAGVEGDRQLAAGLNIGTDDGAEDQHVAAAAARQAQAAGGAENVVGVGAAAAGNGQRRFVPAVRVEFRVGQHGVAIDLHDTAVFEVIATAHGVEATESRSVVHLGNGDIHRRQRGQHAAAALILTAAGGAAAAGQAVLVVEQEIDLHGRRRHVGGIAVGDRAHRRTDASRVGVVVEGDHQLAAAVAHRADGQPIDQQIGPGQFDTIVVARRSRSIEKAEHVAGRSRAAALHGQRRAVPAGDAEVQFGVGDAGSAVGVEPDRRRLLFDQRRCAGQTGNARQVIDRVDRRVQRNRRGRPGVGSTEHAGEVGACRQGLRRIGQADRQAARRAGVIGDREEGDLGGGRQDQGAAVANRRRHDGPARTVVGGIFPNALRHRVGGVADDRHAAQRSGRRAAADGIGGVRIMAAGQRGDRRATGRRGVFVDRRQAEAAAGHRCVIDRCDGDAEGNGIRRIGIGGGAASGRTAQIRTAAGAYCAGRVVDQAYGERSRRAVPVGGRQETELIGGLEQERRRQRRRGRQVGPAAAAVVLPFALRSGGSVADDGDAGQGVGRRTAGLRIGGVGEGRGEDRADRRTGRRAVFGDTAQSGAGGDTCRRVVDRGNGDVDGFTIGQRTADTGISLVVYGNGQQLVIGTANGVEVGGRREFERRQRGVDCRFGAGEHHLAIVGAVTGAESQPGDRAQSQRAFGRGAEVESDFFDGAEIIGISNRQAADRVVRAVLIDRQCCRCGDRGRVIGAGNVDGERLLDGVVAADTGYFLPVGLVIDGGGDEDGLIDVGVVRLVGHRVQRRLDIGERPGDDDRRRVAGIHESRTAGHGAERAVGNAAARRGNGHFDIINGALGDIDRVADGKGGRQGQADAGGHRLVAGDAQGRGVVDRHQSDGVIDRRRLGTAGVVEVGDCRLEIQRAVVEVARAVEGQRVQSILHFVDRTGQRDGVAAGTGRRGQPGGRAEVQPAFGRGIGQRGMTGIAVQTDGNGDVLIETVDVAEREAVQRQRDILIDRVGAGVGQGRRVVAVRSVQDDVLADTVVGSIDGRAIGIERSWSAVGAGIQHAAAVVQPVVDGDADLVVAGVGVGSEGDGQRSDRRIDLRLAALNDQAVAVLAADVSQPAAGITGGVGELGGGNECVGIVEHLHFDADEIGLAAGQSIGHVDVGNADPGHRRRPGAGGKRVDPAGNGQCRQVVARGDFDMVGRGAGRRSLGEGLRIVDDVVAVADHVAETVGINFAAVVPVADPAIVEVVLGEHRIDAERDTAEQQLTSGRRGGDPVLPLDR